MLLTTRTGGPIFIGSCCVRPRPWLPSRSPHSARSAPHGRGRPRHRASAIGLSQHARPEMIAARAERAAGRPVGRQRQLAADRQQRTGEPVGAGQRNGVEEAARIGMAHVVEHLLDRAVLDRVARIHDRDLLAGLEDEAEVVRDVEHRGAELARDVLDELDDAGFDRYVEGGRRLVEQQQLGIGQERHGDEHALLLAARQLVRKGIHDSFRIGQPHLGQELHGRAGGRPCR